MAFFDRFASSASTVVARAPFFAGCVLLVVIWAPSIVLIRDIDTWQLIINTATTIITFLLVALLQNSQERFEKATNCKLDAVARALADLLREGDDYEEALALLDDAIAVEEEMTA